MTPEAEALKNAGNARKAAGDLEGALQAYRGALALVPDYPAALYNAGLVLQEMGRPGDAEPFLRRLATLEPADRDAWFRLGLVLDALRRPAESAQAYESALRVDPQNPLLWLELARAHRALGRLPEARQGLERVVQALPDYHEARNLLGLTLQESGAVELAVAQYQQAAKLDPREPVYLLNLGAALALERRFDEAIGVLKQCLQLRADDPDAWRNLGEVYGARGRHALAVEAFKAADRLAPGDPRTQASLLFSMQHVCDWSCLEQLVPARRRSVHEHPGKPLEPFPLLSIPSTRADQLQGALIYARGIERRTASERAALGFVHYRGARKRLRIGYLSADLHEHATAYWTAELFERHDRSRFEILAYSYGPDDASPMRARLMRAFDRFVDVQPLSHSEAARRIHGDKVDILVDLKGYTTGARPEIAALRPAPVQVSFVGFPGTSGARFIDYLIGDRIVTPPEHAADYSEQLVRVSGSYQVNDTRREPVEPVPREALGLPSQAVVYFCFNQTYKILPDVFSRWMRILAAVPGSILWLLEWSAEASENLRREAAARGIDPGRLVFSPLLPHRQHLARIAAADLLLDTLPYNAHTVTADALWCGVPVLTLPGETFAARVAASQLTAVGMPELIASSAQAYEATAIRLGRNPAELAALRAKLARVKAGCALFDTKAFARDLETAFLRMWEAYAAGRPPAPIDL